MEPQAPAAASVPVPAPPPPRIASNDLSIPMSSAPPSSVALPQPNEDAGVSALTSMAGAGAAAQAPVALVLPPSPLAATASSDQPAPSMCTSSPNGVGVPSTSVPTPPAVVVPRPPPKAAPSVVGPLPTSGGAAATTTLNGTAAEPASPNTLPTVPSAVSEAAPVIGAVPAAPAAVASPVPPSVDAAGVVPMPLPQQPVANDANGAASPAFPAEAVAVACPVAAPAPPVVAAPSAAQETVTLSPAAAAQVPATPPAAAQVPATPAAAAQVPATPAAAAQVPATPAAAAQVPATPPAAAQVPATPPAAAQVPATPPAAAQVPATPPAAAQVPATPPAAAQVPATPPAAAPVTAPVALATGGPTFVLPVVPPLVFSSQAHAPAAVELNGSPDAAAAASSSPSSMLSGAEHTARPSPAQPPSTQQSDRPAQDVVSHPIVVPEVRVSTAAGDAPHREAQGWRGDQGTLTPQGPGGLMALATPRDVVRLSGGTPTPARGPSGSVHSAGTTNRSSRDADSSTASTAPPTDTTMSALRARADEDPDERRHKRDKAVKKEHERELAAAAKAAKKRAKEESKLLRAAPRAPGGTSPLLSHEGPTMGTGPTYGTTARSIVPLSGGGLCVTVCSMSPLRPSLKNIHPFVRVWLVDARSGLLIQPRPQLVSCHTHPFDLRSRGTVAPSWNEELLFTIPQEIPAEMAQSLCEPMLLFEVLDFGLSNIQGDIAAIRAGGPQIAGGANLLHICWGFYKLRRLRGSPAATRDKAPAHKEEPLHLQLFEYPTRRSAVWNIAVACLPGFLAHDAVNAQPMVYAPPQAPSIQAVANAAAAEGLPLPMPPAYHVFANHNYRKLGYPGGLTIQVTEVDACFFAPKAPEASSVERDLMSLLVECIGASDAPGARSLRGGQEQTSGVAGSTAFFNVVPTLFRNRAAFSAADTESPHAGLDFARRRGERVTAPSLIVHELIVHGAITSMDFSPNGSCVALGTNSAIHAVVEIRETLSPRLHVIGMLRGHLGRINQVKYHTSGQFLVSASSDRTARVWRVGDGPCFVNSSIDEQNICIAVLPMGVSCYSATFHADHVVMAGYDTRLLVWHVPQVSQQSATGGASLHLRGNTGPSLPTSSGSLSARRASFHNLYAATATVGSTGSGGDAQIARIVAVAQNSDTAFFLAVVAQHNEDSKLWSLDSAGSFVQWRASVDDSNAPLGGTGTQSPAGAAAPVISTVTMRRRLECPGATSLQVQGLYACLAAQQDRVLYFVDVSTFTLLHRIQLASMRGWSLVPDGRSVAMGAANGALVAYDVTTGDEISPSDGCPRARVGFPLEHVTWCRGMQLAVVASQLGTAAHGVGEDETSACSTIAVLGRPRREEEVVLDVDPKASDFVRATFGGEMRMRRSSAADAHGGPSAGADVSTKRGSRSAPGAAITAGSHRSRVLEELEDGDRAAVLGRGADKTSKIDQIMSYWKGLVSKHGGGAAAKRDADASSAPSRRASATPAASSVAAAHNNA